MAVVFALPGLVLSPVYATKKVSQDKPGFNLGRVSPRRFL